jgi:hypothetical protein
MASPPHAVRRMGGIGHLTPRWPSLRRRPPVSCARSRVSMRSCPGEARGVAREKPLMRCSSGPIRWRCSMALVLGTPSRCYRGGGGAGDCSRLRSACTSRIRCIRACCQAKNARAFSSVGSWSRRKTKGGVVGATVSGVKSGSGCCGSSGGVCSGGGAGVTSGVRGGGHASPKNRTSPQAKNPRRSWAILPTASTSRRSRLPKLLRLLVMRRRRTLTPRMCSLHSRRSG